MSEPDFFDVGQPLPENNPDAIRTHIMGMTQQGKLPSFWIPKRMVRNLPRGVRPWSIFDRKPEIAIVVHEPELWDKGQVQLRYLDGDVVCIMLDDLARCGSIVVDKSTLTKIYTVRSEGQRDLHGHKHEV